MKTGNSTNANPLAETKDLKFSGRQPPSLTYMKQPRFQTRSELLESRQRRQLPPSSYDLDNDGFVGA